MDAPKGRNIIARGFSPGTGKRAPIPHLPPDLPEKGLPSPIPIYFAPFFRTPPRGVNTFHQPRRDMRNFFN